MDRLTGEQLEAIESGRARARSWCSPDGYGDCERQSPSVEFAPDDEPDADDVLKALAIEARASRKRIAELEQAVRDAEWTAYEQVCTWCGVDWGQPHAEDCIVRTLPDMEAR